MKKAEQKLVSFSNKENEMDEIKSQMNNGWRIISLTSLGKSYVGIMEKSPLIHPAQKITFNF